MNDWWQTFFDADYTRLWEAWIDSARTEQEIAGLWKLLDLRDGTRVLDAPCGYGRISLGLARRGAAVLGVDFSESLLNEAQRQRGEAPVERLVYRRHDLREPLPESGIDVALNIFSSLGYGSEADDVAILSTLRNAVRPGGRVFIETNHRDQGVIFFSRAARPAHRLPYGLAAYAFTESGKRAMLIGDAIEAGMVAVNGVSVAAADAPFGGVKESGFGAEDGPEGLEACLVTKTIHQA